MSAIPPKKKVNITVKKRSPFKPKKRGNQYV